MFPSIGTVCKSNDYENGEVIECLEGRYYFLDGSFRRLPTAKIIYVMVDGTLSEEGFGELMEFERWRLNRKLIKWSLEQIIWRLKEGEFLYVDGNFYRKI